MTQRMFHGKTEKRAFFTFKSIRSEIPDLSLNVARIQKVQRLQWIALKWADHD